MKRDLDEETCPQRGDPSRASASARKKGFEPSDVPAGKVGYALFGLLGVVALSLAAIALLLGRMDDDTRTRPASAVASPFASQRLVPPEPRLQSDYRGASAPRSPPARDRAIKDAMKAVAKAGWRDAEPAPRAVETARAHAGEGR